MSTIFDVAKKAKVSVVTVSRLLNNPEKVSQKTAQKISRVIDELNYQPNQNARSLVSKRTNTIGVIMPDIKNPFFNSWFRNIEEYTSLHGFNLLLCNTDENPETEMKYIKLFQSQRVDGLVIAPTAIKSVEYLLKSNINFILFDRVYYPSQTNFVTTNHYQGAYEATDYLIRLGHKKIAVLKGPGLLYADTERYSGFERAMIDNNMSINKDFIINCEFDEMKAYKAVIDFFNRSKRPSAIFSFNGLMTEGVIKALVDQNISIPDKISLVGFDKSPCFDIFRPRITYIYQSINILAKDIIIAIIDKIKSPTSFKEIRVYLKPKFIVGESCKKLN